LFDFLVSLIGVTFRSGDLVAKPEMTAEVGRSIEDFAGVDVLPGDGVLVREVFLTPTPESMFPNGAPDGVGAVALRLTIRDQSQLPAMKTGPNNIVRMI
jgi:hypothetical protein